MEGLRAALPREQFRRMPPREIVDSTVEQAGVVHDMDKYDRILLTTLAHFAFGAAAGAVYGAINGSRRKRWDGYSAAMSGIAAGPRRVGCGVRCRAPVAWPSSCRD